MPPAKAYWQLYNSPPGSITDQAAQAFIDDVKAELDKGFGFVPFIGAGLSAPSGVPLIWEIETYLQRCIARALGLIASNLPPWNPRTDQWPPFADEHDDFSIMWGNQLQLAIAAIRRDDQWDPDLRVFQEAQGAIAEWRTALLFLSRLTRERRGAGRGARDYYVLEAPRQEVIDAAIREIMKGKYPTLGHRMLATLGGLLRLDILLTTNFDDLLEQAFDAARNPLTTFGLHLASDLPPYAALAPQRSLVKLHGDRHSLRADYTLDAAPPELDRFHFLEYLVAASGHGQLLEQRLHPRDDGCKLPASNHLLVMGFSASERRTRTFIEHAWRALDDDFVVFWLCHTARDVDRVQAFTTDVFTRPGMKRNAMRSRILRHTHLGLLFLQLFQTVRRNVPLTGLIFPSASRLAIPPIFVDDEPSRDNPQKEAQRHLRATLLQTLLARLKQISDPNFPKHRLVVITSHPAHNGVTSVGSQLFEELQEEHFCVWLEMNDITSTDDLFEQLLDATYYRLGRESWMPVFVPPDENSRAGEIRRLVKATTQHWVFFLNARETPGSNRESESRGALLAGNGWLDKPDVDPSEPSAYVKPFVRFLAALCEAGHEGPSISVVLLTHSTQDPVPHGERQSKRPPFAGSLVNDELEAEELIDEVDMLEGDCVSYKDTDIVRDCIQWIVGTAEVNGDRNKVPNIREHSPNENGARRRFLLALLLMQRTRFLSSIWSSAFFCDGGTHADELIKKTMLGWLSDLERAGLVRRKHGGFIWLRAVSREHLRRILKSQSALDEYISTHPQDFNGYNIGGLRSWDIAAEIPDIHFQLALWYRRVLLAAESPGAAFEAVYHSCKAADALLSGGRGAVTSEIIERIKWASALLRSHEFMIQTRGYSRGSCRRLEEICKHVGEMRTGATADVSAALIELQIIAFEIMRAIAREVGENSKAYQRHRTIRWILSNAKPPPADNSLDTWETSAQELAIELFSRPSEHVSSTDCSNWLRYWRWTGMLGIASRSYNSAQKALFYGLASASANDQVTQSQSLKQGLFDHPTFSDGDVPLVKALKLVHAFLHRRHRADNYMFGHEYRDSQHICVEVLRTAEQYIDCEIQKLSADRRAAKDGFVTKLGKSPVLRGLIEAGMSLAELIIAQDQSSSAPYIASAMWCKSRLLLHASMCHSLEANPDEAMGVLTDAEACLAAVDARRLGTDHALVELYRAEVRIHQASREDVRIAGDKMPFGLLRATFNGDNLVERIRGGHLQRESLEASGDALSFQRVKAVVRDAVRFLDRAESLLANRRRNVGWTTWFFQRRIATVAMSLWASIFDKLSPIPSLGLQAAPAETHTVADDALHHALRIIRIDVYRLATIIDAYASCAEAFEVRLVLDKSLPRLSDRQVSMREELEAALAKLNEMLCERDSTADRATQGVKRDRQAVDRIKDGSALYGSSRQYVKDVIERAGKTILALKHPVR